ncbi:MAG TPA: alpha/beta hydrolase [Terriglobales bacterium]|nr:alpha/beta hydrolase [Terriglobales bacterium]
MKFHRITGGGDVRLNVVETGNAKGRPILFLHGASQCWLQWNRQFNSTLADEHRLVAIDMRGHGLSDKPQNAYGDSKLWADDVHAVIGAMGLDHPVLSGWSYGPLVILDYIRHYGEEQIGGVQFVGAITKLGSAEAMSVLTPEFLGVVPQFLSLDTETTVRGLEGLLRLCFAEPIPASDFYTLLGYNVTVPPYVRQGLFSRAFSNDDLLPKIRKPVLITHGVGDAIVKSAVVEQHKASMPHAEVQLMPNAGHAAFWDNAPDFNQRLHAFCESCSQGGAFRSHASSRAS